MAAQWHPTRNEDLTPDRISSGTANKVWWVCEHAHEWQASVSGRTSAGYGCPVCAGLKTVTGVNDLVTQFPKVAAQWHPTRNEDLTPDRISGGARQKVWWVCEKGHEWQARGQQSDVHGDWVPRLLGSQNGYRIDDLATVTVRGARASVPRTAQNRGSGSPVPR